MKLMYRYRFGDGVYGPTVRRRSDLADHSSMHYPELGIETIACPEQFHERCVIVCFEPCSSSSVKHTGKQGKSS